jgi:hypothetical protein
MRMPASASSFLEKEEPLMPTYVALANFVPRRAGSTVLRTVPEFDMTS